MSFRILVMGVSGCGKTTIAKKLGKFYGLQFIEGDEYHPKENVDKMRSGIPLTDADRIPWLEALSIEMSSLNNDGYVVACSALKQTYRDMLNAKGKNDFLIIFLDGEKDLIRERMQVRSGHYMPSSLLDSQYSALERPNKSLRIDIAMTVDQQFKKITTFLSEKYQQENQSGQMTDIKADIGIIGLGVMGKALARNFAGKGMKVAVYNAPLLGEESVTETFVKTYSDLDFLGSDSISSFSSSLKSPKAILLMVKAGDPVDDVIAQLLPVTESGDILIDAGNSFYKDTLRRSKTCADLGVNFVGMGVSGGEEGALNGPSMMPAGNLLSRERLLPMLEKVAAHADDRPCVGWIGTGGAGHFVKMIHNGIEYADMQLLSEVYGLYKDGYGYSNTAIADTLETWKDTNHNSYLLDITIQILRKVEDGVSVIDTILDVAGHKGTGLWTSQESLSLGVAAPTIFSSMAQRILSSEKKLREKLGTKIEKDKEVMDHHVFIKGILFCRLIGLAEGFHIISKASKKYSWNISMPEIASVWRGGCIIRSDMLLIIKKSIAENDSINHLFESAYFMKTLKDLYPSATQLVSLVSTLPVAIPAISAALNYYKSMVSNYLPINMIQAQRDYFGSHTYRRNDDHDTPVHTHW